MSLRHRIAQSTLLANILAGVVVGYLRICKATTRWQHEGFAELAADLEKGPVLAVLWHESALFAPMLWPMDLGQLSSLHAGSPIGRVGGALQRQSGLNAVEIKSKTSNIAATRTALRMFKDGSSLGIAADGPRGPALVVRDATMDWARAMQCPVHAFAIHTKRGRRLRTWDQMWFPLPFTRGAVSFSRWNQQIPRKASPPEIEALRADLIAHLKANRQHCIDCVQ